MADESRGAGAQNPLPVEYPLTYPREAAHLQGEGKSVMPEITRPQPSQWIRFRPDTFTMLLAALSVLGIASVMAREITHGVGLESDSIQYIAGARNLLAGEGYSDISGRPVTWWPPLYSLLLATASLGAWDPLDVAGPVNAAVFGLIIFVVGRYLRQRLVSRFLVVWACLAVTLSVPLVDIASWAMSEPLFILLSTLALVRIDQLLTDGKTSSLVWAAVFSALACLTRNMGVVLPVLVGLLLLFQPGTPLIRRARRIAVFSLIAALPTALWVVQSHLLTGDIFYATGYYQSIDFDLSITLQEALGHLYQSWLYLDQDMALWPSFEFLPAASALLLVVALLLASVGWIFARISHERHITLLTGAHYVFGGFAVVYFVLFITALSLGFAHSTIQPRYILPLYIPLLMAAVVALDRLLVPAHDRQGRGMAGRGEGSPPVAASGVRGRVEIQRPLAAVLKVVLSLWALGQVVPNVDQIIRANSGDLYRGYNEPRRWASSETLRWIRENPIDAMVYSTEPLAVYLHNGRPGSYRELPVSCPDVHPADLYCVSGTGQEQLRRWLADVPDGTYVVWFYNWYITRRFDYSTADMRGSSDFEPVAEMADGAIFKIDRSYTPRPGSPLSVYESIVSGGFGEPVLRSTFDIHLEGATLTYLKEPCVAEDVAAGFFLHVVPRNEADLPAVRRRLQSSFDNLDFTFSRKGAIWDGKCLGVVTLPDYEIARIRTGQFIRDVGGSKELWEAKVPVIE